MMHIDMDAFYVIFMLLICHVRGVCIDESSSNKICFLLFGGFFTPNTKMMELMEQDAQLLKTFFYILLPLYVSVAH